MNATVKLFVIFVVVLLLGQAGSVGIGLVVDQISPAAGVAVFIPAYYGMFWIAWRVALYMVERSLAMQPGDRGNSRVSTAVALLAPATLALDLCD